MLAKDIDFDSHWWRQIVYAAFDGRTDSQERISTWKTHPNSREPILAYHFPFKNYVGTMVETDFSEAERPDLRISNGLHFGSHSPSGGISYWFKGLPRGYAVGAFAGEHYKKIIVRAFHLLGYNAEEPAQLFRVAYGYHERVEWRTDFVAELRSRGLVVPSYLL